jgi:hypothetical protein
MFRRWLQQTLKARAQVGRAADVRLLMGFSSAESIDGSGFGKLSERRLGVGGVEGERLHCIV